MVDFDSSLEYMLRRLLVMEFTVASMFNIRKFLERIRMTNYFYKQTKTHLTSWVSPKMSKVFFTTKSTNNFKCQ